MTNRRLPLHGFGPVPRKLGKSRTLAREVALNVALVALGLVVFHFVGPAVGFI